MGGNKKMSESWDPYQCRQLHVLYYKIVTRGHMTWRVVDGTIRSDEVGK